ncbi:cytochrome o ubiquinol oxidase subunit IV [Desulfopila sp. IMCC35006]|uniref:cytochrome o ubiquinol oxidase subunit IV n=1 Tax=Desulfopila sp. IMCC35006 TaxID=2569542 RepID=UPI0010ACC4B0|nr:cytochrome o ubiquinol oxidase subunit IV [Desulfopila sp. IMCC35006]TKB28343.1 cytochrome o ubiquinol oxidase subunit IV [Desulfopila sp. IMCC35006]
MSHSSIDRTGPSRGTFTSYGIGFVLSILLTAIAFWITMNGTASRAVILTTIFAAAIAQILVHLHYFLHLDRSSAASWNVLALIFTFLIMVLFVGGTLWIMHSLDYRMM